MKLNGQQKQALYEALLSAFLTRDSLSQMMVFKMNESLEKVAGGDTYSNVVLNLILWAESHGLTEKLIVGARAQNPGNPELLAFALEVGVESPPAAQPQDEEQAEERDSGVSPTIERIILDAPADNFVNIDSLATVYRRARQASRAVCRIEAYQSMATGFLVARDLLLTAYYVVQDLIEDASYVDPTTREETPLLPSNIAFRFGYEMVNDSVIVARGQVYHLAPDWLVASSPTNELDFALLRLDGSPGLDTIDGDRWTVERGWLKPATAPRFDPGSLLYVLHHPSASPLKLSFGTLLGVAENPSRCTYSLLTAPGSSGAPCFTKEWELLAMHEKSEITKANLKSETRDVGSGVLISEIFKRADVRAALNL
jgi:V8-like Glu-specific endopeptidase